jgi:hypothetical protein
MLFSTGISYTSIYKKNYKNKLIIQSGVKQPSEIQYIYKSLIYLL